VNGILTKRVSPDRVHVLKTGREKNFRCFWPCFGGNHDSIRTLLQAGLVGV
jgi:hypothetical protein